MEGTILIPTDFSKCANDALDYAIEIAKVLKCKIKIVHSIDFDGDLRVGENAKTMLALTKEFETAAETKIKVLGDKVLQNNIACSATIFTGKVNDWLPSYISEIKPILVVMGTTGVNSISNRIFGSNTYSIIKNSLYPVLAVPYSAQYTKAFDVFVVSTDFRDKDVEVIQFLSKLAKPSGVIIEVVHVLNDDTLKRDYNHELMHDLEEKVKEKVDYTNIIYKLLYSDTPESRLKTLVEEKKPDMLSLVMRKQGFFERKLFGSLTETLVHKSNVPVLVFSAD